MKHVMAVVVAALAVFATCSAVPAATPRHSDVNTAIASSVIPTGIKLTSGQLSNFVIAYCLNVAAHGEETTATLFAEVVQQDGISDTQANYIRNVAAATC